MDAALPKGRRTHITVFIWNLPQFQALGRWCGAYVDLVWSYYGCTVDLACIDYPQKGAKGAAGA
jgi:hypothetical protein